MSPVNPDLDFDTQIRTALTADATRAPMSTTAWAGPTYPSGTTEVRRRNPWVYATLAAAAVVTIGAIAVTRVNHQPEDQAAGFHPPGTEYPLTDLGEPPGGSGFLTVAGLARVTQVPGQPPLTVGPSMSYDGGDGAEGSWNESSGGGGGSAPDWMIGVPITSISSSIDNRVADFDVWSWSNVPDSAAYVVFTQGDVQLWQRPIHGVVQFPYAWLTHNNGESADHIVDYTAEPYEAVAFDAAGTRVSDASQAAIDAANAGSIAHHQWWADITRAQMEVLTTLTDTTVTGCLTRSGATFSPDHMVATLPESVDDAAVWSACVVETKAAVAAALAEINPRYYDGSIGERPLVADPPLQWGPASPPASP